MEKNRRFHCFNSSQCLTSEQLCDGRNDCGDGMNDDENDLCSWLNSTSTSDLSEAHYFTCKNGQRIETKYRCDLDINCSGEGDEDELFCNLGEPLPDHSNPYLSNFLSDIIVFPLPTLSSTSIMSTTIETNTEIIRNNQISNDENTLVFNS